MEKAFKEEPQFLSWEEKVGKLIDEEGICENLPDFIVADIKKMKKVENTTLRQVAQPYTFPLSYDEVRDISRLKWKFENDSKYFSMSMPQLGIPKRAIIYFKPKKIKTIEPKDKYPVYVLLNPTFEPFIEPEDEDEFLTSYEKCASVKSVCGLVPRFNHIKFKGYNAYGDLIEGKALGMISRFIQHEIDHLNGLLFTDQANRIITQKELRWRRDVGKVEWMTDL